VIAIFAAMESEVQPLLGSGIVRETSDVAGYPVTRVDYGDLRAVICQTGIGQRAEQATLATLQRFSATAVISFGTAGGISQELSNGDIVLCDRVYQCGTDGYDRRADFVTPDSRLMAAAREAAAIAGLPSRVGNSITVDHAIDLDEKGALYESSGHDIVEMESYWIGKVARQRETPFLTVRVVTDQADDSVISAETMNDDGSMDYGKLAAWARDNPDRMKELMRLTERWKEGNASMTGFARAFLHSPVWMTR
jgi:nucleoside phosphorylase